MITGLIIVWLSLGFIAGLADVLWTCFHLDIKFTWFEFVVLLVDILLGPIEFIIQVIFFIGLYRFKNKGLTNNR